MPEKKTLERARRDKAAGKSASTQAGEFVREQIDRVREGKHGVRNTKQAIAIGLSEARRAGVKMKAPTKGKTSERTREQAKRETTKAAKGGTKKVSATRSRAATKALKRESSAPVSRKALSRQARVAAGKRTSAERSASGQKAARTRKKSS